MQSRIVSRKELRAIEQEVDEICARAELLDPSNPFESEQLYNDDIKLTQYLETLEKSYSLTRRKEIGLTIVR